MKTFHLIALAFAVAALAGPARADAPAYTIIDLGVVGTVSGSQGVGLSPDGLIATGRTVGNQQLAYTWTAAGGIVALPNIPGRNFAVANDATNNGIVVGTSSTTSFGSGQLPVMWNNGVMTQLTVPAGYGVGQALSVNASGLIAGSVGSGIGQRAALFNGTTTSLITATAANGSYMTVAYGINDAGLVAGTGIDPNNAAVNVGMVYDTVTGTMTTVGALDNANGALGFGLSNSGYVVGGSMFNQGDSMPFRWSATEGMVAIGLPTGATQGSARGVNDQGWVVGTAGGVYAVPFLYAEGTTYTLQSLLVNGAGWDLSTNTSSSALSISENGTIVGTAVHNGLTHGYMMVLVSSVPEPGTWALMVGGLALCGFVARRRRDAQQA
jgi:uncharacterized membrane protein